MIIFKKSEELSLFINQLKTNRKRIGFVPTMGALHAGHLSLVERSKKENDYTVCSIFVNPTQFNNPEDFKHYPVTIEKDVEQLITTQCDLLFLPDVAEIYPSGSLPKHYELGIIENIFEGKYRPGHFQGVCQVVDRLLEIIQPDQLYLGQKDLQQCMVIAKLIELTNKKDKINIVIASTRREPDGLAMSSRNLRLDESQRKVAASVYKVLHKIKEDINLKPRDQLIEEGKKTLEKKEFKIDYLDIINPENLLPQKNKNGPMAAVVAASLGSVRLIDNLMLE